MAERTDLEVHRWVAGRGRLVRAHRRTGVGRGDRRPRHLRRVADPVERCSAPSTLDLAGQGGGPCPDNDPADVAVDVIGGPTDWETEVTAFADGAYIVVDLFGSSGRTTSSSGCGTAIPSPTRAVSCWGPTPTPPGSTSTCGSTSTRRTGAPRALLCTTVVRLELAGTHDDAAPDLPGLAGDVVLDDRHRLPRHLGRLPHAAGRTSMTPRCRSSRCGRARAGRKRRRGVGTLTWGLDTIEVRRTVAG